jgi:hypothetical protein
MATGKPTRLDLIRRIHDKFPDTTNYIAIMITISVILQLWWMARGH